MSTAVVALLLRLESVVPRTSRPLPFTSAMDNETEQQKDDKKEKKLNE